MNPKQKDYGNNCNTFRLFGTICDEEFDGNSFPIQDGKKSLYILCAVTPNSFTIVASAFYIQRAK